MQKKLSPVFFGAVLVCFLLPFVSVSCQGQKVAIFSGLQLVTGTTIEQPSMFGPARKNKIPGETLAILALVSAIAGLTAYFLEGKGKHVGSIVAGGVGAITLFSLKAKLDNDILRQGQGMLQLDSGAGFYLAVILFIAAIGLNVYLMQYKEAVSEVITTGQSINLKFCSQCGAKIDSDSAFCSDCGHALN